MQRIIHLMRRAISHGVAWKELGLFLHLKSIYNRTAEIIIFKKLAQILARRGFE
jgi:hypothetical protein